MNINVTHFKTPNRNEQLIPVKAGALQDAYAVDSLMKTYFTAIGTSTKLL